MTKALEQSGPAPWRIYSRLIFVIAIYALAYALLDHLRLLDVIFADDELFRFFGFITLTAAGLLFLQAIGQLCSVASVIRSLSRRFSDEVIDGWHARMAEGRPSGGDPGGSREHATSVLSDMQAAFQEAAEQPGLLTPGLVTSRLRAISRALRRCQLEPENAMRIFQTTASSIPAEFPFRSLAQAFVMLLLYIGIIGTFYGLYLAFDGDDLGALIAALQQGHGTEEIGNLSGNFGLAFGTSLMAYVAFLAGRVVIELMDESYDLLVGFIETELTASLKVPLSTLDLDIKIDLPERTRILIQEQTERIAEASAHAAVAATSISEAVEAMRHLNAETEKSARLFTESIESARKSWEQTSTQWTTATERMEVSTTGLVGSLEHAGSSMREHSETLQETASEINETWARKSLEMIEAMDAAAGRVTQAWETHLEATISKMDDQLSVYVEKLGEVNLHVAGLHEKHTRLTDVTASAAVMIREGQETLAAYAEQLRSSSARVGGGIETAIQSFAGDLSRKIEAVDRSLSEIGRELSASGEATRQLRATIEGAGDGPSLPEILTQLSDSLQLNAEAARPANARGAE